jgi:hypothetical protein
LEPLPLNCSEELQAVVVVVVAVFVVAAAEQ